SAGGFGKTLSGILHGLSTGDFSGLGAIGALFDILRTSKEDRDAQIDKLAKGLEDIFGIGGKFAQTLATGLQNAGLGTAAGSIVAGNTYSTEEQIGAALGGVIGGAIAGPIGAAVAGVLGSLVGGLIAGPAKGSVTISNGQIVAGRGSDQQMLANANAAANITT
ncbi:MAG: hypothetical protein B7Z25_04410, partial [Aerococcus viridans]